MGLSIKKLLPGFGAEITGVDLTGPMDDATFADIEAAFYEYSLLVFHGQDFTDETQAAFSSRFGELEKTVSAVAGIFDEIADLSNVDKEDKILDPSSKRSLYLSGNQRWHTDSSFKRVPALASLLSGREVPPRGGETEFANMRLAYEALPEERKRSLEGLVSEHSFAYSQGLLGEELLTPEQEAALPPVPQAVVRTLSNSGNKTLYVGRHASHILGMPVEEGRALLAELLEWVIQPRFTYLHKWSDKDLVMWDNHCLLHRGRPWDEAKYRRVMHRTTVAGDAPAA
ncbi:MAG: TauD/TfdA family dioxygenase [SAR324 cluster bacterium]|nr:TauD/TfdA family dioxygenase [SAR324 cluster bacterium]